MEDEQGETSGTMSVGVDVRQEVCAFRTRTKSTTSTEMDDENGVYKCTVGRGR